MTLAELREAKAAWRERYQAIAAKHTPEGVTVVESSGMYGKWFCRERRIKAPKPVGKMSLFIYLHECGHAHLGHCYNRKVCPKPRYLQEYEAEQWAIRVFRQEGLSVPRRVLQRAKEYVAMKVQRADRRGVKRVDPKIRAWAGVTQ